MSSYETGSEEGSLEGGECLGIPDTGSSLPSSGAPPPVTGEQPPAAQPRRSTRLVQRSLTDWPVIKILEVLYANQLSAPAGLNHEELFQFMLESLAVEDQEASGSKKQGKATAKKRGAQKIINAAPLKKSKPPAAPEAPAQNVELMMALSDIKSSLSNMGQRIGALENSATSSSAIGLVPASTSAGDAMSAAAGLAPTPRRTLGTAVPAPSSGSPFLSPAGAIPDALRTQIISGEK